MSGSGGRGNSSNQVPQYTSAQWDNILRHSSAIGLLKPNVVFDVFGGGMSQQHLPNPRIVRTGHAEDGRSVFAGDHSIAPSSPGPHAPAVTLLDAPRPAVPVSNTMPPPALSTVEGAAPRAPASGVTICVTDIHPNQAVPMHRTASLDYGVVLAGEIVLRLDGGEEKTIRGGEFIVQQGTNHEWVNRASRPCRLLLVMVGADNVMLPGGTILEETPLENQ